MTRDTGKLLALFTVAALLIALVVVFGPATAQGAATPEGCFKVDSEDLNGTTVFQIDETHTLTVIHRVVEEGLEEVNFIVQPLDPIEVGVTTVTVKAGQDIVVVRDYPSPEIEDEIEWRGKHAISHIVLCIEEVTPSTTTTIPSTTTTTVGPTTSTSPPTTTSSTEASSTTTTMVPVTTSTPPDRPVTSTSEPTETPPTLPFTGTQEAVSLAVLGLTMISLGGLVMAAARNLDQTD